MYFRKITTRLGGLGVCAVPLVIGALAFAPAASAQIEAGPCQTPTSTAGQLYFPCVVTQTPQNTAQLITAIGNADNLNDPTTNTPDPAGTLYVIQLAAGVTYAPTTYLPLDGNIDIVGPGYYQSSAGLDTDITGGDLTTSASQPDGDLFDVEPGAQVELRGFDIQGLATGSSFSNLNVAAGATAELDNVAIIGSAGDPVNNFGNAEVNDSLIGGGTSVAVYGESGSTTTLINDTLYNNEQGGLNGDGSFSLINTVLGDNKGGAAGNNCITGPGGVGGGTFSFLDVYSDDTTCASSSVTGQITDTTKKKLALDTTFGFNGGPSQSDAYSSTSGSSASVLINAGNSAYAEPVDQRFFAPTAGHWDVGSYQLTGTELSSTDAPVCTINTINETPPADEIVDAADPAGLGDDAITAAETDNGTINIPTQQLTVPGATSNPVNTWFEETSPSQTNPAAQDLPSASAFPVQALKPSTDANVNDTKWTFDATNTLGNTTYCH